MKAAREYKNFQQLVKTEDKGKSPAEREVIFSVAFGSGREDSNLKCKPVAWNDILTMISGKEKGRKIQIIPKKFEEFCALPKVQKDRLKNVPWWIIEVKGTHRKKKISQRVQPLCWMWIIWIMKAWRGYGGDWIGTDSGMQPILA